MRGRALLLGVVLGCAVPQPVAAPITVPVTSEVEMKPAGTSWYIHASAPETAYVVVDFFGERGLLASMWQDTDAIRIRTRPAEQPELDHRFQRVTYFVKIDGEIEPFSCSWVELRWVLETRGYGEISWRTETPDSAYQPLELAPFVRAMREKPCKEPTR